MPSQISRWSPGVCAAPNTGTKNKMVSKPSRATARKTTTPSMSSCVRPSAPLLVIELNATASPMLTSTAAPIPR